MDGLQDAALFGIIEIGKDEWHYLFMFVNNTCLFMDVGIISFSAKLIFIFRPWKGVQLLSWKVYPRINLNARIDHLKYKKLT